MVISPDHWDKDNEEPNKKSKEKQKIKSSLIKQQEGIDSIVNDFRLYEERFPTPKELLEKLKKNTDENNGLLHLYNDFIEYKRGQFVENSTIGIYNYTWGKWREFEIKRETIFSVKDLDHRVLDDFRTFLISLGLQPNSVGKYMKTIKTFINYLKDYRKLKVSIDKKEIKVDKQEGQFEVFTKKELELLKSKVGYSSFEKRGGSVHYFFNYTEEEDDLNKTEVLVGRMMVFLCETGLSYVDLSRLTIHDIVFEDKDYETGSSICIKITRKKLKSNDLCIIPILEDMLDFIFMETKGYIIGYHGHLGYGGSFEKKVEFMKRWFDMIHKDYEEKGSSYPIPNYPYLFPKVHNQDFNEIIKDVCKKVGMTSIIKKVKTKKNKIIEEVIPKYKLISSHTGRRTFITLSLNDNIRPDIVMKTTGHKKFETMKRYTKITDKNVSKEYTDKKKIKPDGDNDLI